MTTREHVRACVHPETYKYFIERERVMRVWQSLDELCGGLRVDQHVGTVEARCPAWVARAPRLGNPITLIRMRACTARDIREFHDAVGYVMERLQ